MKKIIVLCFLTILSSVLYSQIIEYEWKDITPNNFSMTISQAVCTKGGIVAASTKEGWLAESSDTGKTWNMTYNITDVENDMFSGHSKITYWPLSLEFAIDSLHGIFTYCIWENEFFVNNILYTSDGGNNWAPSEIELKDSDKIKGITWRDEKTAFMTVLDTISRTLLLYKSSDFGKKWICVTEDVMASELPQSSAIYIAFVNNELGYIFTKGAYCVTKDGGKTWTAEKLGITPSHLFQFANGYIILTVENQINKTLDCCRIINMYDGGNGYIAYYNVPDSMYDLGEGKVWASVSGGYDVNKNKIFSTDSMQTWQFTEETYTPPTNMVSTAINNTRYSYIYKGNMLGKNIFLKSNNDFFIVGAKSGRLFHTIDGGINWSYKDFNTTLYDMQFFSENIIYMSSKDSLFVSMDAGKTWKGKKLYLHGAIGDVRMQFFTKDFGYVYDDYNLYQTQNGGDTWREVLDMGVDFLDYGGTLNGCFANERLGLFRSDNSTVTLIARVNPQKSEMTVSAISENNENKLINITYHEGKWILIDKYYGYIYTCDTTDLKIKKVWQGENYTPIQQYSSLLSFSKDTLVLPMLTENSYYTNDKAIISTNGGETWKEESFVFPCASKVQNANDNTLYAIPTNYNIRIYKGVHRVKVSDFSFEKQENGTIQCSISNADNQNYTAKIIVEQVNGTNIVVKENLEIKSGEPFVITLPKGIEANYVIKVVPEDDEVFEMVQSQEFIVNNGGSAIDPVFADDIQIRVVNGKIECSCEEYAIYNVAGQKVQNNALPSGTYFVHYGTQVKKVVVQ